MIICIPHHKHKEKCRQLEVEEVEEVEEIEAALQEVEEAEDKTRAERTGL